ncbi:hypothetical protein [Commensalibacter melissae]|nr:hypothetical protein [Commensalibacter melissae]
MKVTTATTSPAVLLGRTLMIYCRSSVKKSICFFLFYYGYKKTTLAVAGISGVLAGHDHVTLSFVIQQVTADLAVRF